MALGDHGCISMSCSGSKFTKLEFATDLNPSNDLILYPADDAHESVPDQQQMRMTASDPFGTSFCFPGIGSQFPDVYPRAVSPCPTPRQIGPHSRHQSLQSPPMRSSLSVNSDGDLDQHADLESQSPRRKRKCRRGTSCPAVRAIAEAAAAEAAEISHQIVEQKRRSCTSDGSDSERMFSEAVREKNRQSARDCRLRKKHYILGLENKVEELQKRLDEKEALNCELERRLAEYRGMYCEPLQPLHY